MGHRFFVDTPVRGSRAVLVAGEAHHLQHVMRAGPGDEVELFDGTGREFRARVTRVARSQVDLAITDSRSISREPAGCITLGVALPKGDRQRWLVEKTVELGVSQLVPLRTHRSEAQATDRSRPRLQRAVIEASKQCGRNQLMEICPSMTLEDFVRSGESSALRWLADPSGDARPSAAQAVESAHLAIGPEGGFTSGELSVARSAGWAVVDLGPRILRVETACLVLATLALPW